MKLTNLKRVNYYEVEQYLTKQLNLTLEQQRLMHDREILRTSSFYFFKREKQVPPKWYMRLTLPAFWLGVLLLFLGMPFKFVITGKWGYSKTRVTKFMVKSYKGKLKIVK